MNPLYPHAILAGTRPIVLCGLRAVLERAATLVGYAKDTLELFSHKLLDKAVIVAEYNRSRGLVDADISEIRSRRPNNPLLVVSQHQDGALARHFLTQGVKGYLPLSASLESVATNFRKVQAGGFGYDDAISEQLLMTVASQGHRAFKPDSLTVKQKEIFYLFGEGYSAKEIGARVNLSSRTVEAYKVDIRKILGLTEQRHLIIEAVKYRFANTFAPSQIKVDVGCVA